MNQRCLSLQRLASGSARVRPEIIRISGVTGSATASDSVARILSSRLGEGLNFKLDIRYDERLDPLLGLPTDEDCVAGINDLLGEHKINFEPGSAQIARDASATLDRIAEKMKQCSDFAMEVGGHTDAQGREEMNLELSQTRAEAVIAALMEQRVLTGKLSARGYGETVPIGDNETEAGREANPADITWTNLPTASGQYSLQYSTNNGSSWTSIASNVTGNSYNWTVPNVPSTTCLVRVLDFINTCKFDVSNAVFTITSAVPVLTSPNGGQTYQVGCTTNITWNTATLYTTVRLDYSVDNGTSWVNIITATGNDGTYTWTLPNLPSANCLVRVSNTGDINNNDVSNATFAIAPPVTVTYPNGGETLAGCSTIAIAWAKSPCVGVWQIDYTMDGVSR